PAVRSVLLAAAAGAAFGIASVFTKTVTVDWASDTPSVQLPSLLIIAVLAIGGLLLSQASYRGAGLAAPLATVTVVNPVVAATVGLTLFGEQFRHGVLGTVLALGSGVVAAGGLILLTTERLGASRAGGPGASAAPSAASGRLGRADRPGPAHPGPAGAGGSTVAPASDAPSEPDARGPQIGERIDVGPVVRPRTHLEMEMRSRTVTGRS
ncbi:hypothetical protein GA0115259_114433, partial [Streptomyces sp. MnatMP-M17]